MRYAPRNNRGNDKRDETFCENKRFSRIAECVLEAYDDFGV